MKKDDFLLEIGTEEIPASYILPALEQMESKFRAFCEENRLEFSELKTYGTPRRMALLARGVPERQPGAEIERKGPPVKAGIAPDGTFTKAALNFAASFNMKPEELERRETDKGDYFFARFNDPGKETPDLLAGFNGAAIASLTFPKNMRWADLDFRFARPIRWICSLYGDRTIASGLDAVAGGNRSVGRRYFGAPSIEIARAGAYEDRLREHEVEADWRARKDKIVAGLREKSDGEPVIEASTLEEVNFLVEWPYIGGGSYDARFLDLPEELLLLCIEKTQRYFPVKGPDGKLQNKFLVVMNAPVAESAQVRANYEKVLLSRLKDAAFFWEQDLKIPLTERRAKLSHIQFQANLGSMLDKTERVKAVCLKLAERFGWDSPAREALGLAADLCKADLSSDMVFEFPALQGIMGKHYARKDEAIGSAPREAAALAIGEHYRPLSAEGELPETPAGALISLADKMDTLIGYFSLGKIPSGAGDPYSLRRQAAGVVRLLERFEWPVSLRGAVRESIAAWPETVLAPGTRAELEEKAFEFLKGRLKSLLSGYGLRYDTVNAAVVEDETKVHEARDMARAIEAVRDEEAFARAAEGATRIANILTKSAGIHWAELPEPDESLFRDPEEKALHEAGRTLEKTPPGGAGVGSAENVIRSLYRLTGPVTAFFDKVMVMADDPAIRSNRLALLGGILSLYRRGADFSEIVKENK